MAGLTAELRTKGVEFVRFVWCDNANMLRAKVVPLEFLRGVYHRGVGISYAQQAVPVVRDAFVADSGLGPVGEAQLVADWSSLVYLPYAPGHARVIGDMVVEGQPWAHCPRNFLRRMEQKAASMGLEIQVAFENEFYLLAPMQNGLEPLDDTLFCSVYGLNQTLSIFHQLVEDLRAQRCPVVQFHTESGGGQMELSVHHAAPMIAANRQVTFRETTHALAHRLGLQATFLPKPFADRAGSGCHIHLSLWKDGENITDPSQSDNPAAQHFMAGVLEHLPALMGLTTPTRNSIARIGPHQWSGAFACWGYDNREAAIRVPTCDSGVTHFELKTHDATANPYLALGGIIACGLDGIEKKLKLAENTSVDPGLLSEEEREARKVTPLPTKLQMVLDSLEKSPVLKKALGQELHTSYLAVKREELRSVEKMTEEEEVRLLIQRY